MYGVTLRSGGSMYVYSALHASAVVPRSGPVSGGTRVGVMGRGFREVATLRCRFEGSSATSVARRVSAVQVECASAPSSSGGARRVGVCANGQQWSLSSSVFFTYTACASVSSVYPLLGASEGGTPLTVVGGGFSSSAEALGALRCRINSTVVGASYVSESAVMCNTTGMASGGASVEVSTNGREYTSSGVHIELVSVVVRVVTPWSGPLLGGTVVTVAGSGVSHVADALRCRFGVGTMWRSSASSSASLHSLAV